ncbi:MAG: signal peptidase I [Bacilli bacterium]|nr:signal peptidase I [Bacilli bacterium]
MSKIFKIIMDIFLILLIIILAGYLILRVTNILTIYKVETGSMEDGIHAGDYILIISQKNYFKNDIVTYRKGKYFITHRIIKIDGDIVITKGDANNTADEAIRKNNIVGRVIYSGGILNFVVDFKYAIAGIMIFLYLISSYLESRKDKIEGKEKLKTLEE